MKRLDLPYVQSRKGGRYWYFVKDKRIVGPLPHPSDPEFLTAYNRYKSGKHVKPVRQSFAKLIDLYVTTQDFADLSATSRRIYLKRLKYFRGTIGHLPVKSFKAGMAWEMMEALKDTPSEANGKRAVLGNLFKCALRHGWVDRNPLQGMGKLREKTEHAKAWPADLRAEVEARISGTTRLFYELAWHTGQRSGDVLKMRWSDIEGDAIKVKQEKTKATVWIPISPRLARVLAETPRTGIFLIDERGPVKRATMAARFRKVFSDIGVSGYRLHGLRSTMAQELAEVGLSDEMIASVTGHKDARSLDGYLSDVRQKARAKNAMKARGKT